MILAVESTGTVASAALYADGRVLAEYTLNDKLTHSQTLLPMIDEIFARSGRDKHAVSAIAVSRGPGSFTGLRIGAATAIGLGLALNVPLVPVSTLAAMASLVIGTDGLICPMMDARRSQVYTCVYEWKEGALHPLMEECALSAAELAGRLNAFGRPVTVLGDGAAAYRPVLEEALTVPWHMAPPYLDGQRAGAVAVLGAALLEAGEAVAAGDFRPVYLRASQAERERAKRIRKEAAVTVREGRPEDVPAVAAIELESFGPVNAWPESDFANALGEWKDRYQLFVAEKDGEVAGYLCVLYAADEADIGSIAVRPSARKNGIGRALLLAGLQWMAEHEITHAYLEVREGNAAARALYQKEGFREGGVRKDYYRHPTENAVIMSRSV